MLVYGQKYVKTNGLLDRLRSSLASIGIEVVELGGVQPNPVDTLVYKGIELGRDRNIDGLLAVGGGSVIDTAKAIAAGIPYKGDFWDFFCGKAMVTEALPVGVVLTVPGAGSVVGRVGERFGGNVHQCHQQSLGKAVGHLDAACGREIAFEDVAHHVDNAA